MNEAKQMTTARAVGAASHTTVIPPPRESAASQYRVGLLRFELGRVLVFHVGVFECSSRMTGNLHVRFLEGWASAMAPGYSTKFGPLTARRPDDVYFASAARFMASPTYCLHLSCMTPAICAQRSKASAASLYRLMFSRSAPRMKRSVVSGFAAPAMAIWSSFAESS